MTLFDEQNTDEQESDEPDNGKYLGVVIGVILLPVLFFFTHLGKTDLGLSVFICLGMNILGVGMCWEFRKYLWFWCVITLMLALNLMLALVIQWPEGWVSRFTLLPIGLADMLLTVGAVRFVAKFIVKLPTQEEDA